MAIEDRTAANVCIHWNAASASSFSDDVHGLCEATKFFLVKDITCYNEGKCDGNGTCRDCAKYNVAGAKFSYLDAKNISIRTVVSDLGGGTSSTTATEVPGLQLPMNLAVYNLRAKFQKCCHWNKENGAPFVFAKNSSGQTFINYPVSVIQNGRKVNANVLASSIASVTRCEVTAAAPWQGVRTEQNPTAYGCNGAKPECPFYTGPKWEKCIDSRMDHGDKITATQVQELRYYSADWKTMSNPRAQWERRFKVPDLWAWSGDFEFDSENPEVTDNPMIQKVYIEDFTQETPSIQIASAIPAELGLSIEFGTPDYPTLIKQLDDAPAPVKIVWPRSSSSVPFIFKTFQKGHRFIRIVVQTPYKTSVLVANITKTPQNSLSDSEYIKLLQRDFPDDLHQSDGEIEQGTLVWVPVELEYNPTKEGLNVIKVFVLDPTVNEESYLTSEVFVKHKFYHAVLAQTLGQDQKGSPGIQPWIDKFDRVHFETEVMHITKNTVLDKILWDTEPSGKLSIYPIETVISQEVQEDWYSLSCNVVAVTFKDSRVNSVMPWSISGKSTSGVTLRLEVDRSGNPAVTSDADKVIELEILYKSSTGKFSPANVLFAKPKASGGAQVRIAAALDPKYDVIKATYAVTEYKQGPVVSSDTSLLKYPQLQQYYIQEMPLTIEVSPLGASFSADGLFLSVLNNKTDTVELLSGLDEVKEKLEKELRVNEDRAVFSFSGGGLEEDSILTPTQIYSAIESEFNGKYSGYSFVSDSKAVTLKNTCEKMQELNQREGTYSFMAIFKDETGRPIGIKRVAMLIQSTSVETRDVEIYYEWKMQKQAWIISDPSFLLAKFSEPMIPSSLAGTDTHRPRCGDHSEVLLTNHSFGTPAPMWYPYTRCEDPKYSQESPNATIKCKNFVEGFGPDYNGKRFSYWERMRGPDILRTVNAGPIFLVGCYYRQVDYNVQTIGEQTFTGYTRVRSAHPAGPFAKDREAIRLSRHYIKRNLKVRDEIVVSTDAGLQIETTAGATDENIVFWDPTYGQLLFDSNSKDGLFQSIVVGDEQETPIWVHINDGLSVVDATTPALQHPFSHYLLSSVSKHSFSENFISDKRFKVSEVIDNRDLTSTSKRDSNGTLIFSPQDPQIFEVGEKLDDLVPVFVDKNTAWAWMEDPLDPVRGSPRITGIHVYNPSLPVWKQDRESAVYSEEGSHVLAYLAPTFNKDGTLKQHPIFQWFDGPPRELNWYTGEWVSLSANTPYDASVHSNFLPFSLFGKGATGTSFLADGSGKHAYVLSQGNSGPTYASTFRGIGVSPSVNVSELPYTVADYVVDNPGGSPDTNLVNSAFATKSASIFALQLPQRTYVERIVIDYWLGETADIKNDIPRISMLAKSVTRDAAGAAVAGGTEIFQVSSSPFFQGSSSLALTTKSITYNYGVLCDQIAMQRVGSVRKGAVTEIESIRIWYRRPEDRAEELTVFEQRVNISQANTGFPDYRDLLYYYSRTTPEFGRSIDYDLFVPDSPPSVRFTARNIKDVILEYEYTDPTGTRFAYGPEVLPARNPGVSEDVDGIVAYSGFIEICTKGRTLFTNQGKTDPSVDNGLFVAFNEDTTCGENTGDKKLDELAQNCLYQEAVNLAEGDLSANYSWFWHPQEISFWEEVGIFNVDEEFSPSLTLQSVVSPLHKLFQHEDFGCDVFFALPYFDGKLHPLDRWRGLGHWVYTGNPVFNETCFDVVLFKIQEHIGEKTYKTSKYKDSKGTEPGAIAIPRFPWDTPQDASYYQSRGKIENRANYFGGSIGGAGIGGFFVSQAQFGAGLSLPQIMHRDEIAQSIISARTEAVRADSS